MYHWISGHIPEKYATPVTALIYAMMLILILYFSFGQQAELNYLRL